MTTIISRNNQTQSGTQISSVNTATVEVGELLVDVHNGAIGFLNDTADGWFQLHANHSSHAATLTRQNNWSAAYEFFSNGNTIDAGSPNDFEPDLSHLVDANAITYDTSYMRFGNSVGAKRIHVNGSTEMYQDQYGTYLECYQDNGSGSYELGVKLKSNQILVKESPASGNTGALVFENNSSRTTQIRQGSGQTSHLIWNLPTTSGTAGQVLTTDGNVDANLTWTTVSGGGGSGTVNSGNNGTFAYYASAGTAVSGSNALNITGGKLTVPGTTAAGLHFTKNNIDVHLTCTEESGGNGGNFIINLEHDVATPQQIYMDIEDVSGGSLHASVRIEPNNSIVGSNTKPGLQIGDKYLYFYTINKKGVIRSNDNGGYLLFQACNSANSGVVDVLQLGGGVAAVQGNITATGTVTGGSSRSYKEDIQEVDEVTAYNAVMALEPVTYVYKESKEQQHLGFIAEDVPELVAMNDRKSLAALDITAALTKVIQKQDKEINELKEDIEDLKNLIQNLGVN